MYPTGRLLLASSKSDRYKFVCGLHNLGQQFSTKKITKIKITVPVCLYKKLFVCDLFIRCCLEKMQKKNYTLCILNLYSAYMGTPNS